MAQLNTRVGGEGPKGSRGIAGTKKIYQDETFPCLPDHHDAAGHPRSVWAPPEVLFSKTGQSDIFHLKLNVLKVIGLT